MEINNKKILIVEDDEDFLFILDKAFSGAGFKVVVAKDGESGVKMATSENPDIILSDVLMPRTDGPTMQAKLKEQNVKVPVVFLTNVNMEARAGENFDYLPKSKMHLDDIVADIQKRLKNTSSVELEAPIKK